MNKCPHCPDRIKLLSERTEIVDHLKAMLVACEIDRDKYKMMYNGAMQIISALKDEIIELKEQQND